MLGDVHEHAPAQTTAEPTVPVAAEPTAVPKGLAGMPAVARSLQRTVGNRLVSRMIAQLARDEAPPEAAEPVPLDDAPAPSGGPTPTFDHSGGQTATINADSAVDFSQKITATIGSPHVKPTYEPDIEFEWLTLPSGEEKPGPPRPPLSPPPRSTSGPARATRRARR
jgi:hypothetical protein